MLRVQNSLWTFHTKTVEKIQFVLFKWNFLSQIDIKLRSYEALLKVILMHFHILLEALTKFHILG